MNSTRFAALARTSLLLAFIAGLGGLGCLVTDSPDFVPPKRIRPYLRAISPVPYQLQVKFPEDAPHGLTFEVVSEDLTQTALQAAVVIDFPGFKRPYADETLEHRLMQFQIPAGHLAPQDGTTRQVQTNSLTMPKWASTGCHSVTLIVSHEFDSNELTPQPKDEQDVATLTWWYLLLDADGRGGDLLGCYAKQSDSADAGTDAEAGAFTP